MVKNLAAYKTRVFCRKACLMFMAFIKKAVYYGRESTPQTSVTDEHSSSLAMRQVTIATLIQAAKHHTEINFFALRFHRYISFWTCWVATFWAHPWLGKLDLSTTWSCSFATKTVPKRPPRHPDRLFSGQPFNSLLFCSSLSTWA